MGSEFSHGQEIRAEEIALHQKFISAMGRLQAAEADGEEREVRRCYFLSSRPVLLRERFSFLSRTAIRWTDFAPGSTGR